MNCSAEKVVTAHMEQRQKPEWDELAGQKSKRNKKQLPRRTKLAAAVSFCLGVCAIVYTYAPQQTKLAMSHLTAGFEYDETLGRLQYVSNILPESAMVFLTTENAIDTKRVVPVSAETIHAWTEEEPWLEYEIIGDVASCYDGEVMTVVHNSKDTYTMRIRHDYGYESIYSGLSSAHAAEGEMISAGESIGSAVGMAAFELRKDGLSIQPIFSDI